MTASSSKIKPFMIQKFANNIIDILKKSISQLFYLAPGVK